MEKRIAEVHINMTVMRSNYREIPAFIQMAREMRFKVLLTRIRGTFGDENIFELNDRAALEDLRQVLADPALQGPDVDLAQLAEFLPGK